MAALLAALLLSPPWLVYQLPVRGCPAPVERLRGLPAADDTARDPAWSPDGRRIAFSSGPAICTNGDGLGQLRAAIWVVGADGRGLRRLTAGTALDRAPAWSPDGRRIAFARGDGIHTIGLDGRGRAKRAPQHAVALAWSPDGASLAFVPGEVGTFGDSAANEVDVYDLAFRSLRVLRRVARPADVAWSRDGNRIAVAAGRAILVLRRDGSLVRRIPVAGDATGVDWSPDGRRLTYSAGGAVFVVGADGRGTTRVARGDTPAWRP